MSALDERRALAGDEYFKAGGLASERAVKAIESATRVRVTPELLATMDPAIGDRETRLRAAFEAAGFEVVE